MEAAQHLELIDIQLQQLNQVRIDLGFMWLRKLSIADGNRIQNHLSKYQKDEEEYKPTLTEPHKPKPTTASWKILHRVIQSLATAEEVTLLESNALVLLDLERCMQKKISISPFKKETQSFKIFKNRISSTRFFLGLPELKTLEHVYKLLDPPKNQKELN